MRPDPFRMKLPDRSAGVGLALGALLACAAVALAGCATTGAVGAPVVVPLSQVHYEPTQTVDVLNAAPRTPYAPIARLTLADPTGAATSSQLTAQLADVAKTLGANALWVEQVARAGKAAVAFNPAGGQMQQDTQAAAITVTALAVRYTH